MELAGKTALITGSGVRLGKAISKALAENGCQLALHYNSSSEGAVEIRTYAQSLGIKAITYQADLSKPDELRAFFQVCSADFGHVDILINNAAIYLPGKGMDTTSDILEKQFRLNLFAPVLLIREFAAQIPEDGQGKVVNISDAKVFRHQADHFAYRLTKAAINEMTLMFALELAPRITVNAIAPGVMLPLAGREDTDMQALADRRIPLKRVGSPEIIAENVLHILSQDFMTGTIVRVDGGEGI
ncbi:MAG: SDR family oxidoreductase [Chloroflexi bacterium]|nr:SDR family oxidoreductase [Chloroflexota bacterium]HOG76797.1 SDR family oxidoreductase [Anaerolineaceae bacterium]